MNRMGCVFEQSIGFSDVEKVWRKEKTEEGYLFPPETTECWWLTLRWKRQEISQLKLEESRVEFLSD